MRNGLLASAVLTVLVSVLVWRLGIVMTTPFHALGGVRCVRVLECEIYHNQQEAISASLVHYTTHCSPLATHHSPPLTNASTSTPSPPASPIHLTRCFV